MIKFNSIGALLLGVVLLFVASISSAATSDIKMGLAYLPQASIAGSKVRTPGAIELLVIDKSGISDLNQVTANVAIDKIKNNEIDSWVGVLKANTLLPESMALHELDWSASPVAIMRTDTDIKSWSDIKNRSVCMSEDSRFIGELEQRFGAIEDIYPTVTDALLALRTGECDASLQEEDFVNELLTYPEWQKFSARLQPYKNVNLVELQLADSSFNQQLDKYFDSEQLKALVKDQARDIAFEVYLDQTVPDCH